MVHSSRGTRAKRRNNNEEVPVNDRKGQENEFGMQHREGMCVWASEGEAPMDYTAIPTGNAFLCDA